MADRPCPNVLFDPFCPLQQRQNTLQQQYLQQQYLQQLHFLQLRLQAQPAKHPSVQKREHRNSRAARRGPMDEMRQLVRIFAKLMPDSASLLGSAASGGGGKYVRPRLTDDVPGLLTCCICMQPSVRAGDQSVPASSAGQCAAARVGTARWMGRLLGRYV